MKKILPLLTIFIFLLSILYSQTLEVITKHLEFLSEEINIKGKKVLGYWVYADKKAKGYVKTTAQGEGDMCVDDVARAVVFYTEYYEFTKNQKYLELAKKSADFLVQMQGRDGDFYNFVYINGEINKMGITSSKQHSWWASRAFWALSKISRYLPEYRNSAIKAYKILKKHLKNGLLNGVGDQTSIYLLGLVELHRTGFNLEKDIENSADAISKLYNKGFFSVYKNRILWHGWGNRYVEALLESWKIIKKDIYIDLARKALEIEIPLFLSTGFIYEIGNNLKLFPELSYSVESITVGAIKYYLITKDEKIGILGALSTAWYRGLNRLGKSMYGKNGEGYDGMEFAHINYNSGAESTISALRTILYFQRLPEDIKKFAFDTIIERKPLIVLEAEQGNWGISEVNVLVDNKYAAGAAISFHNNLRIKWKVPSGKYYAVVVGKGNFDCTLIGGKSKIHKKFDGNFVILDKFELNQSKFVKLICKGDGILDQLILIPEKYGIITNHLSVFYKIGEGLIVKKETKEIKKTSKTTKETIVNSIKQGKYLMIDLNNVYNNNGIGDPFKERANFDNLGSAVGSYLPIEIIEVLKTYSKIPFKINWEGKDNIRCNNQILLLNKVFVKNLYLLASANHGNYEVNLIVNGKKINISVPDWCSANLDFSVDYRYLATGEKQFIRCGMKLFKISLEDYVDKIILPNEINVHIFAITLETE